VPADWEPETENGGTSGCSKPLSSPSKESFLSRAFTDHDHEEARVRVLSRLTRRSSNPPETEMMSSVASRPPPRKLDPIDDVTRLHIDERSTENRTPETHFSDVTSGIGDVDGRGYGGHRRPAVSRRLKELLSS